MIEIEIPCSSCIPHPLMALPYTTDARITELKNLRQGKSVMPLPIVKKSGDAFVVVSNWDVVSMLNENPYSRVRVYLLKDDDEKELEWCIKKHVENLKLPWTSLAMATLKAKLQLSVSDQILAGRLGIERSTVARLNKIASKLSPSILSLADRGILSYSDCRKLVTLPFSQQERLASEANEKMLDSKRIMAKAFPVKPKISNTNFTSVVFPKSSDVKRLEIDISEKIGYPFSIESRNAACSAGEIEYQFFDRQGLIDVMSKLRSGFSGNPTLKGRIKISFDSLDEFESLTGGYFK